jgi:hypothetical protein
MNAYDFTTMIEEFGEECVSYMNQTGRFLPDFESDCQEHN